MKPFTRRGFLEAAAAAPLLGAGGRRPAERKQIKPSPQRLVKLSGDGLSLSPDETVDVLRTILGGDGIDPDYYSRGGVVEELEHRMAEALGKERAVFFPTGTLANHVAIRILARNRPRVLVPSESHLYNDSGDCAQQLSQLNLVPMVSETATFTLEQVEEVVERTGSGRVETGVGAILIESPVRRKLGEMFDYDEMKRICAFARARGIGTHLDGARLYMASAYSGITPKEYASHFDTVYVSLWKYFNAASGAILAGPAEILDDLYHTRRMFGGGLPAAWPFAAVALHYFETFEDDFHNAVQTADRFCSELERHPAFAIEKIPNGSNIFKLTVNDTDLEAFRATLKTKGVLLSAPRPSHRGFLVNVNPTWNRTTAEILARHFREAV